MPKPKRTQPNAREGRGPARALADAVEALESRTLLAAAGLVAAY
jgi:hypothetical protein